MASKKQEVAKPAKPGGKKTSAGIQQALWLMMTDRRFRKAVASGKVAEAVAKTDLKLSKADLAALSRIDPSDLEDVVARFEKDITIVMGGSRPRPNLTLSDATVTELRNVLEKME